MNILLFSLYPVHDLSRYATKYDIFITLLAPALVLGVLLERAHDRDGGLSFDKGNKNFWTVEATKDLGMCTMTVRLQVHASMDRQCLFGSGVQKSLLGA